MPEAPEQLAGEQIATPPQAYPFINTLRVLVTVGPWAGGVIHLPNADAAAAITDKWAVDFEEKPHDATAPVVPLTEAEYAAALAAANTYVEGVYSPPATA